MRRPLPLHVPRVPVRAPARVRALAHAAAALLGVALAAPSSHAAGGTLGTSSRGVTPVAVRVAIASDGARSTRWQMAVLPPGERVAWLVPARPGASLDLAGDPFFAALDDATVVRVARPSGTGCGAEGDLETLREEIPQERASREPSPPVVLSNEGELARFATEQRFTVPAGLESRAFRDGFVLLALTFHAGARASSTPVVRVSDDGPAVLPLVLTRATTADVPVTAWVLSEGPAQLGSPVKISPDDLLWGPLGSSYPDARARAIAGHRGFGFLTEAASHDLVLGPLAPLPDGQPAQTLAQAFAARVARTTPEAVACSEALFRLRNAPIRFGRACAAGALGRIPGPGEPCAPTPGDTDVAVATCGTTDDDLALAFSGKRIDRLSVTRARGVVTLGGYGTLVAFQEGVERSSLVTGGRLDPICSPPSTAPSGSTPRPSSPPRGSGGQAAQEPAEDDQGGSYEGSGCSGGGGVTYVGSETDTGSSDESCSGSSTSSDESSDSGCGGDTVGGDNDSSSDACASDSSSSSDSCSSDSGGDSCSDVDASSRRGHRGTNGKSPVSRAALALFALALPLRRLFRKDT